MFDFRAIVESGTVDRPRMRPRRSADGWRA